MQEAYALATFTACLSAGCASAWLIAMSLAASTPLLVLAVTAGAVAGLVVALSILA